jgi:outer membrane lipoprotein LolB
MSARICISLALMLLGAGCAQRATRVSNVSELAVTRQQTVSDGSSFHVRGRIAISQRAGNDSDGGNGRFEWQQREQVLSFSLSAPLSNKTWTLEGMPGSYVLTDSAGKQLQNTRADFLVEQASGWRIPVAELRFWLHAMPSPDLPVAAQAFNGNGTPKQFEQSGWLVSFERYEDADCTRLKQLCKPLKLSAKRNADGVQSSVKVIVSRWL